jgi:hypothetical protein
MSTTSTETICNILNNSYCVFDASTLSSTSFPIPDPFFGLFHLKVDDNTLHTSSLSQHFVFVVDHSGSMSYKCSDGITKMTHVVYTLNKIVQYFSEYSAMSVPIYLTVFAFDNNFEKVVKMVKLDDSTKDDIIEKINNIRPQGLTNIELALKRTKQFINECLSVCPERNITQIFMTDGDVTVGSADIKVLQSECVSSISNIFIGFGLDHNAHMLSVLGDSYYFIDNMERSGLVYGEVLSSVLCCIAKHVSVKIVNGYIYDWKHNVWKTELFIGDIVSDKTYHLIASDPSTVDCILSIKINDTVKGVVRQSMSSDSEYFTKYKYRQQTQELLYEVNTNARISTSPIKQRRKSYLHISLNLNLKEELEKEKKVSLKERMYALLETMKTYMNGLTNENDKKFMKLLCDDIYVCIQTHGTPHAKMYSCTRYLSQGSQRVYSSGEPEPMSETSDFYQISDYSETPYSTKSVQEIMKFLDNKDGLDN